MNYLIDIVILIILIFYLIDGYRSGFIKNSLDFFGFIFALSIAFLLNSIVSNLLVSYFSFPLSLSKIVSFLIIWLIVDIAYSIGIYFANRTIPKHISESKYNKFSGIIPAFLKAIVVVLLILIFFTSIPIKESLKFKKEVDKTFLARLLLNSSSSLQKPYQLVFGSGIEDLINFFTLPPQSDRIVSLSYRTDQLSVDEQSENEMITLVNNDRNANGLPELKLDEQLREIARNHARDMFLRGYFSHYTPEGLSPFDRMKKAGIFYIFAGENLALAPDVYKAEQGLMNSQGHRENILNSDFNNIGVGVIDAGIYGKMFVQEFKD